jgi:hypothetical protein
MTFDNFIFFMTNKHISQSGQTLITLLIFMVVAVTITTASVVMIVSSMKSTSRFEQGTTALQLAESGAENALIRLLRDPSYTNETLTLPQGTVTITVTGTNPITIVSEAKTANTVRKIEISASYINEVLTVTSWKEVF